MDGASRGSRFVLCAVLTAIVLAGGGFAVGFAHGVPAGDRIARAALSAPNATSAAIVIATGDGAALGGALAAPPVGAITGPMIILGLAAFVAARYPGHPEQAAVLRARGFAAAAGSTWTRPGMRTSTELVQFRDSDGATGYLHALRASYITDQRVSASFGIPNVADGYAYVRTAAPGGEIDLFAQIGPVVVELTVITAGPPDREVDVAALVRQTGPLEP